MRGAFAQLFTQHPSDGPPDLGSAVAVVVDGSTVVDLWGGWADAARTRPWERDTIVGVMSVGKGITALSAHMLADRGLLDYDAPVTRYWPEFGAAGKDAISVRQLMSHQAGLTGVGGFDGEFFLDWERVTSALEEAPPEWPPGTAHGYHTLTFGHLVGELVRRVDGRDVGTFVREEINAPLGLELYVGLRDDEDDRAAERCLQIAPGEPDTGLVVDAARGVVDAGNTAAWRAAQIPAANFHTDARSLARVYGALARGGEVDGVRLVSPDTLAAATAEQVRGIDLTRSLAREGTVSAYSLGWMTTNDDEAPLPHDGGFGHGGMFGSWGWASPDAKLGFGYVLNGCHPGQYFGTFDPRGAFLLEAVVTCL